MERRRGPIRALTGAALGLLLVAVAGGWLPVPGVPDARRAEAAAVASTQTGNWNSTATWGGNPVPGAADDVTITAGTTVTVNATATVSSLTVQPGATLNIGGVTITVTGATDVDGILAITSATGNKNFGSIEIGATGTFTNTTEAVSLTGGLTNDGAFTAGTGIYTFSGAGVTIGGANAVDFERLTVSGTATITGTVSASNTVTVSGALTNSGTLTVTSTSAIAGSGTVVNSASRTLTLASSSVTPTLDASAAGNTVVWDRDGAQTVKATTYHYLTIGGASGTKTTGGAVTVNGNVEVVGGALTVGANPIVVSGTTRLAGGNLTSSGAAGANTKTFSGAVTVQSGTLTISASTGDNEFAGGVTVEAGGTWTHSGAATVVVTGDFVHRGAGTLSSGPATITGDLRVEAGLLTVGTAALTVNGATSLSGGNLTSSGNAGAKTKTFTGDVTVGSGSTWTTTAGAGTNQFDGTVTVQAGGAWTQSGGAPLTFNGNLVNAGTFTATDGTVTLAGSGRSISGASAYAFDALAVTGTVTASGTATVGGTLTVNGALTNNGTLTVTSTSAVAGGGTLVNGPGATLALSSGSFAPTMAASGAGNTVQWNRASSTQSVSGGTYHHLVIAGGGTKTAAGAITVGGTVTVQASATFSVPTDLDVAGNVEVTGGTMTITTPTVTVAGALNIASGASWTHTGAGSVTIGSVTSAGTYSITGGTESITGNLAVTGGTATFAGAAVTVGGTTTLSGGDVTSSNSAGANVKTFTGLVTVQSGRTFSITATSGTNQFLGDVVVDGGGTWTQTGAAPVTIAGNVTNNGAFGATAGTVTFTGASKALTGNPVALSGVTVTGTLTASTALSSNATLTVDDTLTIGTALTLTSSTAVGGAGTIVSSANSTFALASASLGPTLLASAAGNTVEWNRGGNQTIAPATYYHLVLATSGTKTTGGAIAVNGNVTVQGSAAVSVGTDLTVGGDLSVLGGSLSVTVAALTVGGTTTLNGGNLTSSGAAAPNVKTFSGAVDVVAGTLTVSASTGTHAFGSNVTIGAGSTWTHSGAAPVTVAGKVTTAGTYTASGDESVTGDFEVTGGTATIGAATVTIGGATTLSGGNLTSSGAAGARTKTFGGTFTVGNGRTFTLSATSGVNVFLGDVVLGTGATWTQTSSATVTIAGSLQNGGTFSATAGSTTFSGTGKTITGNAVSLDDLIVSGSLTAGVPVTTGGAITVDGALVNDSTLTFTQTGVLGGGGTITNNAGRSFTLANSSISPTLDATAAGNTVTWNRAGAQTVKATTYRNLVLGGPSGTKTAGGDLTVQDDLTVGESAVFAFGANTITLHGNLVVTSDAGAPLSASANSLVVFAAPATPGATAISGTSSAALAFRAVSFENPGGVTVGLSLGHTNNPMAVASGVTLTLSPGVSVTTSNTVTVASGAAIAFADSAFVGGSGTFTLADGAAIRITSPDGIEAGAAAGHVRTSSRSLGADALYTYAGTSAQSTGSGLPASVGTLTIDNAAGVTLTADSAVTGTLTLQSGTFSLGSATLTIAGTVSTTGGALAGGTAAGLAVTGAGGNLALPALTLGSLTVDRAAGVTLGGDLTAHGAVALTSGLVTTGARQFTIAPTGSLTRTSGYVAGSLSRGVASGPASLLFAIGDATAYAPVTLVLANVTTPGTITASTSAGDHASIGTSLLIANHSVNRTWTLTPTGVVFTAADATFSFVPGDLDPATDTSALVVSRFDGAWSLPATGTRTTTSTQATGLTALGTFQVALRLQALSATTPAPASATFNDTFSVAGVSTSGLVVVITTSGGCSGGGAGSATITMTSGTTTCTVHYNQPGDSVYPAATELTSTTTAQKAAQSITVTQAAPASAAYGDAFTVAANASSSLPVAITTSGSCSGSGTSSLDVTMTGSTGSCGVQYAQGGNADYLAATPANSTTAAGVRALTVTGVVVRAREFDGTTDADLDVTAAALVNVVDGDNVTLDTSNAAGTFADAGPGTGIAVTVSGLAIGGADAAHYSLTPPALLGTIGEAPPPSSDDGSETLPPTGEPVSDGLSVPVPALQGTTTAIVPGADAPARVVAPAVVDGGTGLRIGQAAVTVPANAIPGAASLVVRSIASLDALLAQAPPPADGRIVVAVSAMALDAQGRPVTTPFAAPARIEITLPLAAVSGVPSDYVIVFWDGSAWTELPTQAALAADGTVRVSAEVSHFTLFAVKRRAGAATPGAFAAPPVFGAEGQAFAVFIGGDVAALADRTAAEGAAGAWVQASDGSYRLLVIGGPAFLRDEFLAAFPGGLPPTVAVTLVRQR